MITKNLFHWGNLDLFNFLPLIIYHHYHLIVEQKSMSLKDRAYEKSGWQDELVIRCING